MLALLGVWWLAGVVSGAEPAGDRYQVIVNPANPTTAVSRERLAAIFLRKATRWDSGEVVAPVDQRADSQVRQAFTLDVLERPLAAVRTYWTQRIFSGRGLPPPELPSDEAVVHYVATHAGAVGYVSAEADIAGTRALTVR